MTLLLLNLNLKQLNNHYCFYMSLGINSEQSDRMSVLLQVHNSVIY